MSGDLVQETWETAHLEASQAQSLDQLVRAIDLPTFLSKYRKQPFKVGTWLPLLITSVVPAQTAYFKPYPQVKTLTLEQIPLQATYPTLGVDRAVALWGASECYGWPVLVIDAGTALTFSGADQNRCFTGGAILAGLGLQGQSLGASTADLPQVDFPRQLPCHWARNTSEAIQAGIVYTLLAGIQEFIQSWRQRFPQSPVVITGGDCGRLYNYLQASGAIASVQESPPVIADPQLIFKGMAFLKYS